MDAAPLAAAHPDDRALLHRRTARPGAARRAALRRFCRGRRADVDLPAARPVRVGRRLPGMGRGRGPARRPADACDHRQRHRRGGRHRRLYAHRPGLRRHRGRQHHLQPAPATPARRHRGDVPDDAPRVRRTRLPPLRVEVQFAEHAEPRGGAAPRLSIRRAVPPGDDHARPQPRHDVVLGDRQRMAGAARRVRALARPGEFRRRGTAAAKPRELSDRPPHDPIRANTASRRWRCSRR